MNQDGLDKSTRAFADALWRVQDWSSRRFGARASRTPWDIIISLAQADHSRLSLVDLESRVHRSHRTLQYVLRDLDAAGLVSIERSEEDRRRTVIVLSDEGQEGFEEYKRLVQREIGPLINHGNSHGNGSAC
ncbi:MAG TPA: MarR family transcriptional regulator [Alphaproteobacteria bacterium]|nr:MarR family transcriptional regulator [Alphaproteobacteria bacterium]